MAGVRRGEAWLLLAASAVLVAGIVTAVALVAGDDGSPPVAAPSGAPSPSPSPTTPSPTTSASPAPAVSGVRITTYSQGSQQLAVRVRVGAGATAAVVQVGSRSFPLQVVDGEATGTVPLACDGVVPELVLVVTSATGEQRTSLGRPTAAVAAACGAPLPGSPLPTGSPRGS